jgi:glycosyltransferase involved in cell wall biosynthesis
MKILFPLGAFYPAQSGGPNNTIYWLTEALTQQNIDIYVVTTNLDILNSHNVKLNKWLSLNIVNVIYCKTFIHYFPVKFLYESILKLKEVDIVQLTGLFYPPSLILYLVNKIFYKKKVVWSPRGELATEALVYGSSIKKYYLKLLKKLLVNDFYFHTTSNEETTLVLSHFKLEKIIQLPNYIKPNKKIQSNDKFDYLLFIGRISPKKAIENLIKAIHISVVFNQKNMKLIIAGNNKNSYGDDLKKLCKDLNLLNHVEFIGHVEKTTKDSLYANAYITVMPSHNENFGNVVVESLSQGTPVIASTGTPWQILQKYKAGYWISNSPEKIAEILDDVLILSKQEYNLMRLNSEKLMNEEFDVRNKVKNWIEFYNLITKKK